MGNRKNVLVIALVAIFAVVMAACAPAATPEPEAPTEAPEPTEAPMEEEEPMEEMEPTIAEIAAGDENFSTLVAALEAAGLVETFAGEGEFTVFAPTNDAFAAAFEALGITAEELLADTETLTGILTYHVVEGEVTSEQVVELSEAPTLNGAPISIEVVDGSVILNGEIEVVTTDIQASNGVIHVIDGVLLPPSEEDEMGEMQTIAEIAAGDENFSTLVAALEAAALVETFAGEGEFTVFAPTNDAFAAAFDALGITAEDLLADTETLTGILTYHVAEGTLLAEDVLAQNLITTLNGAPALAYSTGEGAFIQNAQIVTTDIQASNGVIHVIDAVILPPAYATDATQSIVEVASENGSFGTLLAAAEAAGLAEALSTMGPITVFAPTDAAFEASLAELGITAEDLLADTETLTDILLYHVAVGAQFSEDVVGAEGFYMANGDFAAVDADALTIAGAPLNADLLDIEASNGVIHVIDAVMLPPSE